MATTATRLGALGMLTALVVGACSGGFGGAASPSAAPATQPASAAAPSTPASAAAPSQANAEPVTLTYFVDDNNVTAARLQGLIDAYQKLHPNVTIEIETHPGGTEGDNLVKTRLATGDMPDLFYYNSGSLLQALNPADTLVDLSAEPFIANIQESYLPTVSAKGGVFGVPTEGTLGGGILYNKKIYSDLGLQVPKTWDEFAANNDKIKADGKAAAVCATFGDTWTSQLFVLADYYNVQTAVPDFATKYTANQVHYEDTPAAQAGFQHLQEAFEKGWFQKDFGADKFDKGQELLATGKCAHYPMLTFAVGTMAENFPDTIDDIGFFGQPGDDAATNGATIWMPAATYIPKTTEGAQLDAAKAFVNFIGSVEGAEAMSAGVAPSGPYVIKGSTLPDTVPAAIKDIQPYIDGGNNSPALEFLSPVKGPSLEQITVAVGSGLESAADGAKDYDKDVEKQAKQLGLPGW
jgi:raffinose/stachyose/melibiose transport system substrate-binding protein